MSSWSLLHDIAYLYLFLAAETDGSLAPAEVKLLLKRLQEKAPERSDEEVRAVAEKALTALREEPERRSVSGIVESLKYAALSDDQRRDLLNDLLLIARADGRIHENERAFLRAITRLWEIELPRHADSGVHDLALVFLFMAMGTDGELDPREEETVAVHLRHWKPHLKPEALQGVIKEAVQHLQDEHRSERLREAIAALRPALPSPAQRRRVLDSLMQIAKADGRLDPAEVSFFKQLAADLELL